MVISIACGAGKDSRPQTPLRIDAPLLSEFSTNNSDLTRALDQIITYLDSKNAPTDSLYLTDYQTDSIPWAFRIDHYRAFVEQDKFDREMAKEDSLRQLPSGGRGEIVYVPKSGNQSGHDRWITYNPKTSEINDYLDQ
ncbi:MULTISPECIES: hypothetical protein [unclassified Imperialibacter]|uniref:hypothetical protein n=1 Tax=unclassified Imperialibacter TaxID=2629706 RepID=UPI00125FAB46|nr:MULTISPECIES: hypothetical protein [unclassified Imperialibacter]